MPITRTASETTRIERASAGDSQCVQNSSLQQQKFQTFEPKQLSETECNTRAAEPENISIFQQAAQRIHELGKAFFSKSEQEERLRAAPQESILGKAVRENNERYGKNESFINQYGERVFL
ncbi:MAG: hypothetical protein JSR39_01720 [Verrucomicrobia bacterium]|nr:hypothetical protein [Verrucomicrobiota bacterium]